MKRLTPYIIALLALFSSCGDAEFEYSRYPCAFTFDNTASRSLRLSEAMNPLSPGVFCHISLLGETFQFYTNMNSQVEKVNMNAVDKKLTLELGINNNSGIIVGYGNLNNPATFYAYDSQCPNCYKSTNLPRYQLTMSSEGTARCNTCHRTYDMNNGGIVTSGDGGDKLIRYRASTSGPQGILKVNN